MKIVRLIALALAIIALTWTGNSPLSAQTASGKTAKTATPAADLIDINHANTAQLKALPGIGDAYSAAIVKNRPYKNKTQLLSKGVIPEATYNKIRDKIIAKQ